MGCNVAEEISLVEFSVFFAMFSLLNVALFFCLKGFSLKMKATTDFNL